jgi:two-component system, chemotaxis family, sensor kinase CheA
MREVVVHTLTDPLVARPEFEGATELGDGTVILILDVPSLLRLARKG